MTCYEEGRIAHGEKVPIAHCPYTQPHLRDAWRNGWQEAEKDAIELKPHYRGGGGDL